MKPLSLTLAALALAVAGTRDVPRREAANQQAEEQARSFLARHCAECHSGAKPKGKFHVEQLSADFGDKATRQRWQAALKRIQTGEMPPESKPRPPQAEVAALAAWVAGKV
jgi:mono/diheme cytochrome c family protein